MYIIIFLLFPSFQIKKQEQCLVDQSFVLDLLSSRLDITGLCLNGLQYKIDLKYVYGVDIIDVSHIVT